MFDRIIARLTGMRLAAPPVVPLLCAKRGIKPGQVTFRKVGKAAGQYSCQNSS